MVMSLSRDHKREKGKGHVDAHHGREGRERSGRNTPRRKHGNGIKHGREITERKRGGSEGKRKRMDGRREDGSKGTAS